MQWSISKLTVQVQFPQRGKFKFLHSLQEPFIASLFMFCPFLFPMISGKHGSSTGVIYRAHDCG